MFVRVCWFKAASYQPSYQPSCELAVIQHGGRVELLAGLRQDTGCTMPDGIRALCSGAQKRAANCGDTGQWANEPWAGLVRSAKRDVSLLRAAPLLLPVSGRARCQQAALYIRGMRAVAALSHTESLMIGAVRGCGGWVQAGVERVQASGRVVSGVSPRLSSCQADWSTG